MAHCISLEVGDRLRRLAPHYEMVWATGWEDRANDYLLHLLGLDRLPGHPLRRRCEVRQRPLEARPDRRLRGRPPARLDRRLPRRRVPRVGASARPSRRCSCRPTRPAGSRTPRSSVLIEWAAGPADGRRVDYGAGTWTWGSKCSSSWALILKIPVARRLLADLVRGPRRARPRRGRRGERGSRPRPLPARAEAEAARAAPAAARTLPTRCRCPARPRATASG